uniref:Odorant receptor n=1 Tax=Dendroctonus ponderosae TaxID=77166 RepID=R9PSR8_DENPD
MFSASKWVIMSSGSWGLEVDSKYRILYKIYVLYIRFIYITSTVAVFAMFLVNLGSNNDKAIEALSLTLCSVSCIIRLAVCLKQKVVNLLKIVMEDQFNYAVNDPKIKVMLQEYKSYVTFLCVFVVCYTYSLVILFNIFNGIIEFQSFRKLHPNATEYPQYLVSIWLPFNVQTHFTLALICQTVLFLQSCVLNYSSTVLFNTLMIYVVIKLKILQHLFQNFNTYPKNLENFHMELRDVLAIDNLKHLIRQHQDIISFVKELDKNIKIGVLIEYTITSLMLATISIQVLTGNKVASFSFYGLILIYQLFLLSWNAAEIKTQSEKIAGAIYATDWYVYGPGVKQIIHFIIMRCSKGLSLDIGPFGPNDLGAASARLKLAYSYVSVMGNNK